MFLAEPPRTRYDVNFRLAGIPVRVHPLFWLMTVILVATQDTKPVDVLMWVVAVFISILVHELGHAFLIRYYGWRPRVILYSLGGLAAYEPTWHRMLPQIIISFAGPAAGFLLAGIVVAAILASGHGVHIDWEALFPMPIRFDRYASRNLTVFVYDMLEINILWGVLNLLPIYPLDGGKISQEVLNHLNPAEGIKQSLMVSIFTAGGMAVVMFAKLGDLYAAIFFVLFAVMNYQMLQQYNDRFGGRGW
ncbi:MAG TPA: site-2 protease family protein [Pirellulales bacterium]|nr:site-2 protease family protein [Pirellulales bacterium]